MRLSPAAALRYRVSMRLPPALLLVLALTACGSDPDARSTGAESRVTAKAVADVDAAMAEARRAPVPVLPPVPEPAAAVAAAENSR